MSLESIFNEFEEKKEKPSTKEVTETSKETENEAISIPEGGDEAKQGVKEEAPAPSEEVGAVDWFGEPVKKPAKELPVEKEAVEKQPIEEQAVEEEAVKEEATGEIPAEEAPSEEAPIAETPAEENEDWFQPAIEEQTSTEKPSVSTGAGVPMSVLARMPIVVPAVSAEVMRESMQLFQNLKASLLDKSRDVATIQGKPYIKRSGWRKLALAFNVSDEILKEQKEEKGNNFVWYISVRVWAPNGRSVVGIGACSSEERNFAHVQHDVYATAHTRAKNRGLSDLVGAGEVSWEELRGFDNIGVEN
jgi:hypothetical protein